MCFEKRKSRLDIKTVIDYIVVNNRYRGSVKDAKAIGDEEVEGQHCPLAMDVLLSKEVKKKKFRKKMKLLMLTKCAVKGMLAEKFIVYYERCYGNED